MSDPKVYVVANGIRLVMEKKISKRSNEIRNLRELFIEVRSRKTKIFICNEFKGE